MALITPARAFTCDPKSLLDSSPCLACLSEHEMLAALVGVLALAAGKTAAETMDESKCFTCLSDKQLLQALITKIGNDALGEGNTVQDVIDTFHCLVCATPKQLKAALIQQLCAYSTLTVS